MLTGGCLTLLAACVPVPALPETLDVATSAADRVTAARKTGPADLADSTWSLARIAESDNPDPNITRSGPPGPYGGILAGNALERPPVGERIFLVEFGPGGEMVRITENRFFLADIYGPDVPVGGEWTGTTLPGVFYRSASYGIQIGDRFGVAVVVNVRFGEVFLGRAILYAWGTMDDDRIDGQFGYLLDFTDGAAAFLGTVADQYAVEGQRVAP
jgi:hypothetical protein